MPKSRAPLGSSTALVALGHAIRRLRTQAGFKSQRAFAEAAGYSLNSKEMGEIERGQRCPPPYNFDQIVAALRQRDVSEADLKRLRARWEVARQTRRGAIPPPHPRGIHRASVVALPRPHASAISSRHRKQVRAAQQGGMQRSTRQFPAPLADSAAPPTPPVEPSVVQAEAGLPPEPPASSSIHATSHDTQHDTHDREKERVSHGQEAHGEDDLRESDHPHDFIPSVPGHAAHDSSRPERDGERDGDDQRATMLAVTAPDRRPTGGRAATDTHPPRGEHASASSERSRVTTEPDKPADEPAQETEQVEQSEQTSKQRVDFILVPSAPARADSALPPPDVSQALVVVPTTTDRQRFPVTAGTTVLAVDQRQPPNPFPVPTRAGKYRWTVGLLVLTIGVLAILLVTLLGRSSGGVVLRGQSSPTHAAAISHPSAQPTRTLPTAQPSVAVPPGPAAPTWLLAINGLANGTAQGGYPFVTIDLSDRTAASLPLQAVQPIGEQLETSIWRFAYSPQTHQLAYVLASTQQGTTQMQAWLTTLQQAAAGAPALAGSPPRDLSVLCPRCQGALAFSPSGTWLLSTDREIVGLNLTTGTQQILLSTPGTLYTDLACSPDGTSLAVVADVGSEDEIDLLASHDCLPSDPVTVQARLVASGGPMALTYPVFSLDGTMLAFDLNSGGSTGSLWHVMVAPVSTLKSASQPAPISLATQVSGSNCYESAWVQAPPDTSQELVYACASDAGVFLMRADPAANPPTPSLVFPSNQESDDHLYAPLWLASLPAT